MLFSGFIDGKLIYILELPYDDKLFLTKLETGLKKRFPDGDIVGEYLRSANFSFKDFKESENLKIVFCLSKFELNNFKKYMSADLFNYLYNRGA
jgi:hypothetical protein